MLAQELEDTLRFALNLAAEKGHEYATLEHLLLALTHDKGRDGSIGGVRCRYAKLRHHLLQYIDESLEAISGGDGDAHPTNGFQRVVQRAVIHTQSSNRETTTGANVLAALFAERESHAVWLLSQQEIHRVDVVSYISHGIAKNPATPKPTPSGIRVLMVPSSAMPM